jgi:hypothetical protein
MISILSLFNTLTKSISSAMSDNKPRENPNDDVATNSALNLNKIWDDGHLVCYLDDNQKKQ